MARAQLRSLGSSGADRVALIPAYRDLAIFSQLAGPAAVNIWNADSIRSAVTDIGRRVGG
jgi:hypothetical protein